MSLNDSTHDSSAPLACAHPLDNTAMAPLQDTAPETTDASPPTKSSTAPARQASPAVRAALATLVERFPQLFGPEPRPLKRGVFEDLAGAGLEGLDRDTLKLALAQHTRSTRYLQAVAHAQPRHDLQGKPVEAMAPEHTAQALLEVFRRRQRRDGTLAHEALVRRLVHLMVTSDLSVAQWADCVQTRDEGLARAMTEARDNFAMQLARDEALLRAFDTSGTALEDFAHQYGLPVHTARMRLASARRRRTATAEST